MTKPIVLLTGATGHIGFRTLLTLLEAQYTVRIAIRRPEQNIKILNGLPHALQDQSPQIEFVLVEDMTVPNAYATAIQSCTYAIHIASPIPLKAENQKANEGKSFAELLYTPAISGTLELLKAAAATPSLKRVIITSSGNVLASVTGEPTPNGSSTVRRCPSREEAYAVEIDGQAYKISKILALTAARDFMAAEKRSFSTVYICPGYVQGSHGLCSSVDEFYTSTSRGTLNTLLGRKLEIPDVTSQIWVGDVARAHVDSLTAEKVGDGDVLVLVGNQGKGWQWDDVAEVLRKQFSKEVETGTLNPVTGRKSFVLNFDSRETGEKLGWEFAGPEVWAKEVAEQYLRLI